MGGDRDDPKSPQRRLKDLNRSLDEIGSERGNGSTVAITVIALAILVFLILVMLL